MRLHHLAERSEGAAQRAEGRSKIPQQERSKAHLGWARCDATVAEEMKAKKLKKEAFLIK